MISGFAPSQLYIRSTTLSKFSVLLFIDATAMELGAAWLTYVRHCINMDSKYLCVDTTRYIKYVGKYTGVM